MPMPLDVAYAAARNRLGPNAWAADEWSIGNDGIKRRWCSIGTQTDEYSRHIVGAGATFEAAFSAAMDRLPQDRRRR